MWCGRGRGSVVKGRGGVVWCGVVRVCFPLLGLIRRRVRRGEERLREAAVCIGTGVYVARRSMHPPQESPRWLGKWMLQLSWRWWREGA